jgi:hypothetical protein
MTTSVSYNSFSSTGYFGETSDKKTIPLTYSFQPEESGRFYSDFHKDLSISKDLTPVSDVDYSGIHNYEITGDITQ